MSFVLELIDTSEKRAEFGALELMSPFTHQPLRDVDVRRWVVDRSRGLYFVSLGGGAAEMPYFLVIADKDGPLLHAEGQVTSSGDHHPPSVIVKWSIESVAVNPANAYRAKELTVALREALTAYGSHGNAKVVKSMHIKLPAPHIGSATRAHGGMDQH